jgi:3-dehydroquinate synthase
MLDEFEKENPDVLKLIAMAIDAKRRVVEEDEKESGLRRSLNFGHTIGHAIESSAEDFKWLHGECVAAGMLYMIRDEALGKRVASIEKKLGLPKIDDFDKAAVMEALSHDKKSIDNGVACVFADGPGKFSIENKTLAEIEELLEEKPYEKYVW